MQSRGGVFSRLVSVTVLVLTIVALASGLVDLTLRPDGVPEAAPVRASGLVLGLGILLLTPTLAQLIPGGSITLLSAFAGSTTAISALSFLHDRHPAVEHWGIPLFVMSSLLGAAAFAAVVATSNSQSRVVRLMAMLSALMAGAAPLFSLVTPLGRPVHLMFYAVTSCWMFAISRGSSRLNAPTPSP